MSRRFVATPTSTCGFWNVLDTANMRFVGLGTGDSVWGNRRRMRLLAKQLNAVRELPLDLTP